MAEKGTKSKAPISNTKLILHFDISKTIVFKDFKDEKSVEQLVSN